MKLKKYVMFAVATLSLGTGLSLSQTNAHALASYWKSAHWVTLTQNVTVYKINNYSKQIVKSYTAHSGSHYKMNHWDVNYSWVLQSGHFNTGNKYTYTVHRAWNSSSWFKMGTHKVTSKRSSVKYKSFHGYRIATSKSDISYNTFYDKSNHATLSNHRPTQKSKVIFEYGSHVIPTHHEWTWFHGADKDLLTDYHYVGGKWVKKDTTDVSKI